MHSHELPDVLLQRFKTSAELQAFVDTLWPLFRAKASLNYDEIDPLAAFILREFTARLFNSFLAVGVWPAFRERARQQRIASAAEYRNSLKNTKAARAASPISTRVVAVDGTALTEAQVVYCANHGTPVRRIADGKVVVYRPQFKRWIEQG